MIVRSKAPLRLSFAGGGTDVPPYPQERGGAVLSATIDKYAYASLIPSRDDSLTVQSLDYDVVTKYHVEEDFVFDGHLDLVKATVRRLLPPQQRSGMKLFLQSDAPPGSGLGSSSTVVVALVGVFKDWLRLPMTDYEHANIAYQIERVDLGIKGGMQDQYAATFGGFNFIEFVGDTVIVNPLRVGTDHINELEYNLILCYTGAPRLSARILEHQIQNYVEKKANIVSALDMLKELAYAMKNALLRGRLDDFGDLLHQGWVNKQQLASQIATPEILELYEIARKYGALGGKITGAGGGGYLLLYCPFEKKHVVTEQLERLGGQVVRFGFEPRGIQTWRINGK